jgi:hypothetical protein
MSHIKRVLEVAETFEMDLKGEFLARSYFMCGVLNANVLLRWHWLYGRNERIHLSAVVGGLLAISGYILYYTTLLGEHGRRS